MALLVMADFDGILTDVMGHAAPWSDAELRDISTVTFARPDVSLLTVHGAGDDNVFGAGRADHGGAPSGRSEGGGHSPRVLRGEVP